VRLGHDATLIGDTGAVPPGDRFYSRFSHRLGATGLRWAGKLNVPLYRLSGGRVGGRVNHAPVLLLTTTGRRSGQQRTAPVVYLEDAGRFVVINTNAGNARVPAWSLNLKENPDAEVEVGRRRVPVRARIAEGEERADLWRRHNLQYSGFDEYADELDRRPSVFVLEPRG
jgi:deazaflavin-dependent oxidoreductase (nitroreductase family)